MLNRSQPVVSSRPKSTKKLLADHLELLDQLVRNQADATLEELRSRLR